MAGLKSNIVVVNQFSVKGSSRHGNTPGYYVQRYAARADATENLMPTLEMPVGRFAFEYVPRADATEQAHLERLLPSNRLVNAISDETDMSGRAFGPGSCSLTHDELLSLSKQAQAAFDNGKTVMLTVVSFDTEYLAEMGLAPEGFAPKRKGDWRGKCDQMKLRRALNRGLADMSRGYDDLRWVGAVQVDTMHVHAHLVLWDEGRGSLVKGQQRGKITDADKKRLRAGIDRELGGMQELVHVSKDISASRLNLVSYITRHAYTELVDAGVASVMFASLPEDRTLWRADSHARSMQRANGLARNFVESLLARPDSGYIEQLRSLSEYAVSRAKREGSGLDTYQRYFDTGRERMMSRCVNAVYSVLKTIPEDQLRTPTGFMSGLSNPPRPDGTPLAEAGLRIRAFVRRHDEAAARWVMFDELIDDYDSREEEPGEGAEALRDYYDTERDHAWRVMSKYRGFLACMKAPDTLVERTRALADDYADMVMFERMCDDTRMGRMKPEVAEQYGRSTYGHRGGRHKAGNREAGDKWLRERRERMREEYEQAHTELERDLIRYGWSLDYEEEDEDEYALGFEPAKLVMARPNMLDFDEVKACDLHMLTHDFHDDIIVSFSNIEAFARESIARREAYDRACEYLRDSHQEQAIDALDGGDVLEAATFASVLVDRPVIEGMSASDEDQGQAFVEVDDGLIMELVERVQQEAASTLDDINAQGIR